ncbi:translation initiation factor IF-2-like [Panicum virgatum]|uniref:translation initiation factor IF-2-like n=1 Tax=Panicum virgatum TaxID=38727 RepID=UPI0019D58D5D|nr:translation initiation factor IF-2-like [Panicum virgatum]
MMPAPHLVAPAAMVSTAAGAASWARPQMEHNRGDSRPQTAGSTHRGRTRHGRQDLAELEGRYASSRAGRPAAAPQSRAASTPSQAARGQEAGAPRAARARPRQRPHAVLRPPSRGRAHDEGGHRSGASRGATGAREGDPRASHPRLPHHLSRACTGPAMGAAALGREVNTRQRACRREAGPLAGVGAGLHAGEGGEERGTAELGTRSSSSPLLAGGGTAEAARRRRHRRSAGTHRSGIPPPPGERGPARRGGRGRERGEAGRRERRPADAPADPGEHRGHGPAAASSAPRRPSRAE